MASFKADNIETDDESDDEPDDTKEIQIEEALKVYQNAVKLQSQGLPYLKETGDAYKALFESDVFNYPESWSEYRRVETYGDQAYEDGLLQYEQQVRAVAPTAGAENAPSTLPQVLHLSYKNRALHYLDGVRASLQSSATPQDIRAEISKALNDFTEALDKDEDDVDLWRRAAKISQVLKSRRISRYCLETVVEGDEQGTDETLGDAGMEIKLADHDLDQITSTLDDEIWQKQAPTTRPVLPPLWRKQLSLYSYLPELPEHSRPYDAEVVEAETERSWSAVGEAIYQRLVAEQEGSTNSKPEAAWRINVPDAMSPTTEPPVAEVVDSPKAEANDDAQPMEQSPEVASAGVEDQTVEAPQQDTEQAEQSQASPTSNDLPTRKRSSEAAELPEEPEGGRVRSKRLRARESMTGEALHGDLNPANASTAFDEKIQASAEADEWLSEVLRDIVKKIGVDDFGSAKSYRDLVSPSTNQAIEDPSTDLRLSRVVKDFYNAMQNWNSAKSKRLLQSSLSQDTAADARGTGLSVFLEHSNPTRQRPTAENFDAGLGTFLSSVNNGDKCTADVAFEWVCTLLCSPSSAVLGHSSYTLDTWPSSLRDTFMKLIVNMDEILSSRFRVLFDELNSLSVAVDREGGALEFNAKNIALLDVSQSLFEAHLDIYVAHTDPDAKVDEIEKLQQRVRLNRWSGLARDAINLHLDGQLWDEAKIESPELQQLQFRHLWASVQQLKALGEVDREHLVLCIEDLKRAIDSVSNGKIELPNNNAMPELSIAAADGEISKLETMDFFAGIFEKEGKTPVDLIESLEPLLEKATVPESNETNSTNGTMQSDRDGKLVDEDSFAESTATDPRSQSRSTFQILSEFIESSSTQLQLSLWDRLLEAYEAIDYPSKLFSIRLRSIQIIMGDLSSKNYTEKNQEAREEVLLDFLRDMREILKRILDLTTAHGSSVFDCLDINHLRSSIKAMTDLWTLLYAVGLFDDYSQAGGKGGSSVNPFRTYPSASFHAASVKLHDMQIQTSIILYKLIREAMHQLHEEFPNSDEVGIEYLRHMHYHFGVRRICKACDSSFLHFMQDEILSLPSLSQQSSTDLAQVLYDLYDINCFSSPLDRQDHGCDADYLDRKTAMQLIDFVMEKASNTTIKDLLKSDLGKSMEKLHSTLGMVKSNMAALRNRKFFTEYLKSPVQPVKLFRCLQGIADISTVPVNPKEDVIASKGWYLLKGQISLAKHRAQRAKSSRGSEEDLNDAITFFMQDLEYDSERWETWYRLAQAHDCLLEEQILWGADKINNKQAELAELQRSTIHTYTMATAVSNRTAEPSKHTAAKITEMYYEFAVCIYSATRHPFAMRAFSLDDFPDRHFSNADSGGGQYSKKPFAALSRTAAWKFAIALLNRAAAYDPDKWTTHYMLGKCFWKLHSRSDRLEKQRTRVLKAFFRAVETLPRRKDPGRQEPILEPIYKLVSVVNKLVQRKEIGADEGTKLMEELFQKQNQIDVSKRPQFALSESWASYVIDTLKMLRTADKSKWHHRLVVRAAHLMYDQPVQVGGGAQAAKDYLTEAHLFNKLYAPSVWKPENERPGRHWVYTQQYAQFMARLLAETTDVEGIQLLAKRVRKKPDEYQDHVNLWEYVCGKHVELHRSWGHVRQDCSDLIFKHLDQDEFSKRADLIDKWICAPQNTHRLHDVLRETAELKKLNSALVKPTVIDDLLADTYAEIWEEFGSTFEPIEDQAPAAAKESTPAPPAEPLVESPPKEERRNVMSLTNLMNLDGSADTNSNARSQAATPTPSQAEHLAVRTRPRLISKREIIKRANDVIITKPVTKAASPPTKPVPEPSDTSGIKVIVPELAENDETTETVADGAEGAAEVDVEGDAEVDVEAEAEAEADKEESAAGSVHDSADDESELSDVIEVDYDDGGDGDDEEDEDEEEDETNPVVVRPIFPNLYPRSEGGSSSSSSRNGEASGAEKSRGDADAEAEAEEPMAED